ncbi:MAG: dioxygenase [Alphaproteobacteria bacterium]|nr:dioxygenase [Alphaproteobacteria bacterium]
MISSVIEKKAATTEARYFRPRRIGHANIYVSDLDRSMAFYKNVVGLREAYRRPPIKAGFLNNGNTHHDIGMVEVNGPASRGMIVGLFHIGWELENQVDLLRGYQRATADGFRFDMMHDHDISYSVYFRDPVGTLNEIYADTKKRWWRDRTGEVNAPNIDWTPNTATPDPEPNYELNPKIVRVEGAVFHPVKITGCCLVVDQFEATVAFYRDKVGLALAGRGDSSDDAVLRGAVGTGDLSLFRAKTSRPAQFHHLNFVCADEADLEASIARAKKERLTIEAEVDAPSRRALVVRDPDGNRINFYVDRAPTPRSLSGLNEKTAIYLV